MRRTSQQQKREQIDYLVVKLQQLPPRALTIVVEGCAKGIDRYLHAMERLDKARGALS